MSALKTVAAWIVMIPVVAVMLFICAGFVTYIPFAVLGISHHDPIWLWGNAIVALGLFGWMRERGV